MIIKIDIECDTYMELFQHIHVIRKDIKKVLAKQGIKNYDDLMNNCAEKRLSVRDNNCYGSHDVIIKP